MAALGCHSFALLFDDIDPCMCQADRVVFPSLAKAQASVANEVYQELGQPSLFLFCPTGTPHSCMAQPPRPQEPRAWPPQHPTAGWVPRLVVPSTCVCWELTAKAPPSPSCPRGALEFSGLGQEQAVAMHVPCPAHLPCPSLPIPGSLSSRGLCPSRGALCSLPRVLQLPVLSQPQPVLLLADHRPGAAPRDRCHLDR